MRWLKLLKRLVMANPEHLEILKKGVKYWNKWRHECGDLPDLSGADLRKTELIGINLSCTNLRKVIIRESDFTDAILTGADFSEADLYGTFFTQADFSGAVLVKTSFFKAILNEAELSGVDASNSDFSYAELILANLYETNAAGSIFVGANLTDANLFNANLCGANLSEAKLQSADLAYANLTGAKLFNANLTLTNFTKAILNHADLQGASFYGSVLIETDLTQASIEDAIIYGVSVWNIKTEGLKQRNLIITRYDEPILTVDNIEVAQFIYLILNNQKIRDVIGTIAKKGVLILGRFTPERKQILDAIREKLREYDLVPIMFDFDKAQERDFTETVKILVGMSKFVIADITNPRCAPLELQATVPDYQIPFAVIKQKDEHPFSMFVDLQSKYDWVLPIMNYTSEEELLAGFKKGVLDKVLAVEKTLLEKKLIMRPLEDDIGNYRG